MLDLNDPKWQTLKGGYKKLYDVSVPLKNMEQTQSVPQDIWDELWEELFHQEDVDIASYAAIPHLVRIYKNKDWLDSNILLYAATIEKARLENDRNPPLPDWLKDDYTKSLYDIIEYATGHLKEKWNFYTLLGFLMLVTLLQKDTDLADLLNLIDESQAKNIIDRL